MFLLILPFVVFILGVLAYLEIIKLIMPFHTVIMCTVLLCFAIFFAPQNEYCVYAKIKKNSLIFESDLKDYIRTNALNIDGVSKANASFNEFFENYLHKLKPLSFGHIASAVFPMMGILGTFISIAISMPSFANNNLVAIESEISELLSGIATAFYVSIYGIFLTIWWMFFSRLGIAKINSYKETFRINSKNDFWTKEELERISIKKNYELLQNNSMLINKLYDNEFFTQLTKLHREKLSSFSELFKSYEKVATAHTQLAQKSLDLSNKNSIEIQKSLNEFIVEIEHNINEFSKIKNDLVDKLTDFKNIYNEEQGDFKVVNELKHDIENLSKEASAVLNKISNEQ